MTRSTGFLPIAGPGDARRIGHFRPLRLIAVGVADRAAIKASARVPFGLTCVPRWHAQPQWAVPPAPPPHRMSVICDLVVVM